jgi:hypothetical protein
LKLLALTLEIKPAVCTRNNSDCHTCFVYIIHPARISPLSSWQSQNVPENNEKIYEEIPILRCSSKKYADISNETAYL